jgi:hypothetical protein
MTPAKAGEALHYGSGPGAQILTGCCRGTLGARVRFRPTGWNVL